MVSFYKITPIAEYIEEAIKQERGHNEQEDGFMPGELVIEPLNDLNTPA